MVIRETLFSMVRVHINIIHDYGSNAHGSLIVGQQTGQHAVRVVETSAPTHERASQQQAGLVTFRVVAPNDLNSGPDPILMI